MDTLEPTANAAPTVQTKSSPVLLVIVWLIVGIPALWGVSQTVKTSLNLFNPPASTQPATAPK